MLGWLILFDLFGDDFELDEVVRNTQVLTIGRIEKTLPLLATNNDNVFIIESLL